MFGDIQRTSLEQRRVLTSQLCLTEKFGPDGKLGTFFDPEDC